MGQLQGITLDIEGASTLAGFEVIEIVDDNSTYPTLLGIDQAIDMNRMINLEKLKMIFEKKSLYVIIPLDPAEGSRYMELMHEYEIDGDLDCIYKITTRNENQVNPTMDEWIAQERKSSYTLDSDEEIKRWKNRLHEVTKLNCNMMTRLLHCVSIEIRDLPTFDSLSEVDNFFNKFEKGLPEKQRFQALDWVLCAMLARWWGTHKGSFEDGMNAWE